MTCPPFDLPSRPGRGYFLPCYAPGTPTLKRAVAFIDGQNLFHAAKEAFGHRYPDYDVLKLARATCERQRWELRQVRFYTGIPDRRDKPFWHHFWSARLLAMSRLGRISGRPAVSTFSRRLTYRNKMVRLPDHSEHSVLVGEEKGIDVRIAIDVIRLAHQREYDVAILFSQDQDLSEVAQEVRAIAVEQGRWLKVASAFPLSPTSRNSRGIDRTDWIPIDRAVYEQCLDLRDYRPKRPLAA